MNTRFHSERAIVWRSAVGATCYTDVSLDTADPLSRMTRAPGPLLDIVFGGAAGDGLTVASAAARPPSPRQPETQASFAGKQPAAPIHPHRIELSIDSLPNYMLIEPIPVAIDPVDDTAFTAWVPNLETNATGYTVVEALLLLKERIEAVYGDLNKRAHLTNEQKMTLQMLHTYIAPNKPEWV